MNHLVLSERHSTTRLGGLSNQMVFTVNTAQSLQFQPESEVFKTLQSLQFQKPESEVFKTLCLMHRRYCTAKPQ